MKIDPPKYALKFLRWFCREDYLDEVEGDLIELFEKQYQKSPTQARFKFTGSVFRYLRPEYMKIFHRSRFAHSIINTSMIINYFKLAFRNLRKRSLFSFINITGLAVGVCACLVILNYMSFELSYDSFNKNANSIYRINRTFIKNGAKLEPQVMTTYGLGPALATDLPEVKRFIRMHSEDAVITYQQSNGETKAFHENKIAAVDSTFFRAFTFSSAIGDLATSLDDPNSIVFTQKAAKKYFGNVDPLGKIVTLAGGRMDGTYKVSAVMQDVPPNSHFTFEILLPIHNIFNSNQYRKDDGWQWNNFVTYVQLNEGANSVSAAQKLPDFCKRKLDPQFKDYNGRVELALQPLLDIHLHPGLRHDASETISRNTIYYFGIIAVFILFIAWINYINLSTARALERAREVGIKKTIGAQRSELITQFFVESVLINFIAIVLAVGLAFTLLPVMSNIIGKSLSFDFHDLRLWGALASLFLVGTLASGIYPAFVLSSFRVTSVLKGKAGAGRGFSLRKALVVFQFASSLVLIAGTFVVYRQINFMHSQDKGLLMDQMLVVPGPGTMKWREAKQKIAIFKDEARKIPGVLAVATSGAIPGGGHNWGADVRKKGSSVNDMKLGSVVWVDPDFINTYDISFVAGKNFNSNVKSSMESVVINEASLAAYNLGTAEQALNEQLLLGDDTLQIAGVVKNFNWSSLKSEFVPFLFCADTIVPVQISLHLKGNSLQATVNKVEKLYKELMPSDPFEYSFLDDTFNNQYKSEAQFGKIFALFASLAVAISCLGLWGLASFTTSQKLKEIGVRKVLGATVGSIVYLLCSQFLRLVLLASLVATPLAWFGMRTWLSGFAFRVGLQWDLFVLPVLVLMLIALITVSIQVLKGAVTNPARILRSE